MLASLPSDPPPKHDFQAELDATDRIDAIPTILDVVCRTTGMGFAAVARVTEKRWVACKVLDQIAFGLKAGDELQVDTTICHAIQQSRDAVVIDHVAEDPEFHNHPTPAMYGFQSYISVPIIHKNGKFFGTLCAIDPRPARLKNPETIGMFTQFAELIASHLDNAENLKSSRIELKSSQEDLQSSRAALLEEQRDSVLREEFIAVLGHDLRNPLASITSAARLLQKDPPPERRKMLFEGLQASAIRMADLIDNVLDFARGRLGSGIPLGLAADVSLAPLLDQVVNELRIGAADRRIVTDFDLSVPVRCDPSRIGQLVSNLLGNALTHGAPGTPVRIHADTKGGALNIWVANLGVPIPPAALERLFQPFFRGEVRPSQQGLGLGLYIASEIAKAHGGVLTVVSTSQETRFTFKMSAAD